jgi:hypothetical protein
MAKLAHSFASLGILKLEERRIDRLVVSVTGLKEKSIYRHLDWCMTSILQPLMETMLANQFRAFAGTASLLGIVRKKRNESDARWRFSAPKHITVPLPAQIAPHRR